MSTINKIRLINFKRFRDYTLIPNDRMNILVGDNEVGKSSILEAIDLVASGNLRRVEAIGIDKLLNVDAVKDFCAGERTFSNLPKMIVDLYLTGDFDLTMNGKYNVDNATCDGIRLVCEANEDYVTEINQSLQQQQDYFPYDYYSIRFTTFANAGYTGFKKKLRSVMIDSSHLNSEYATTDFIKRMYSQYTEDDIKERAVHKSQYRMLKSNFRDISLQSLNSRIPTDKNYSFGLRGGSSLNIENDLMIYEGEVGIDSKGTGEQVFIKTDFALERAGTNVDVILLEEPETHLSHTNLRKLIQRVSDAQTGQIFVTTHNSLISTRLELRNLLIMHKGAESNPTYLNDLEDETAKYFQKAPVANVIEFAISQKVILVEGPSEYMLFEKFYISATGNKPESDNVHILDIRGLSFKRYLDIAQLLNCKVAVITDNDADKQKNCIDKYADYSTNDSIKIFYDSDENKFTFEKVLYADNCALCDELFGDEAETYMLNNKTEAAYALLDQERDIVVPGYIREAIEWIKE